MSKESDAEPDLSFSTAADLRDATGDDGRETDEDAGPAFTDLQHPERTFPRAGGMRYDGATVFELRPASGSPGEADLAALVERVLSDENYRHGDWFDLPLPVYLVHDDATGDTFRVAVRDDAVELHVRSDTGAAGLRAFYERLVVVESGGAADDVASPERVDAGWRVSRRTD
jgi:hypothetical protein